MLGDVRVSFLRAMMLTNERVPYGVLALKDWRETFQPNALSCFVM